MPQPGKQVGRRRTMYADGGNIPQIDEESPLDIDAKVSFYNLSPAPTVIARLRPWLQQPPAAQ
jgi:hypothetical protein